MDTACADEHIWKLERQGAGDHHCIVRIHIHDGILLSGRVQYPLSHRQQQESLQIAPAVFLVASFLGAIVNADAVWAMGDIGYGLMAWANIIAIALLAPKAVALLKDYEKQKKEGKDPTFDPAEFGIEEETGAWK